MNETISAEDMPELQVQQTEIEDLHRRAMFELDNPDQAARRMMWQQTLTVTRDMLLDLNVIKEAKDRLLHELLEPARRETIKQNLSIARQALKKGYDQINSLKGEHSEPCEQIH